MVLKKIIFQNRYVALETPSSPPPFMAKTILNFHFDYWNPSLMSQPYITMMKGPAPNIDVSHLPNHGFVVKVVVADSEEFEIVDNLGSL